MPQRPPIDRTPRAPRRRLLAAAAGLAAPWLARPAAAAITWTLFCQVRDSEGPWVRGLRRLSDRVRDATQGGLLIQVRTAGMLPIDANDVSAAVADGRVQMGADGMHAGMVPAATVLRLPMLVTTPQEFADAARVVQPVLEAGLLTRELVLLGHFRSPLQCLWSRRRAGALADISGQRLRVVSTEQAEFTRAMGGAHAILAGPEVPEALETGRVHGTFTTATTGGRQWREQLRQVCLAGPNFNDAVIVVGRAALHSLPAREQQVLRAAGAEAADWITRAEDADELRALQTMARAGLAVIPAQPDDVQAAVTKLAPFWDSWVRLRGRESDQLLAAVRQRLNR